MTKATVIRPLAVTLATGAGAAAAAGVVALARGETRGAPGITKALARLGRTVGGSMLTGVALSAASGALVALAVHGTVTRATGIHGPG